MESVLNSMASFIKDKQYNIYGVTEIIDGEENSVEFAEAPWSTDVYSVSKFISGAAVGLLYDRGLIDLHTPVVKLIENCPVPKEPKWNDVTLHDCLRHKTGLLKGNLDIDGAQYEGIEDWLEYILALPIEGERDVDYHYNDADFYLVCRVVESIIHENVHAFLHRELFTKLGFRESSWSVCTQGYVAGGSGFCANDRDIARLGFLWANEGKYKGRQLLSPEYIKLSISQGYGIVKRDDYPECYYKTGANGQIVIMLPEEKRCVMIRGFYSSDDRTILVDEFFTKK